MGQDGPDYSNIVPGGAQYVYGYQHASSHEDGGTDEINVQDLSGVLADEQKSNWDLVSGKPTTFPPEAHATSHEDGGSDEIDVTGLSGELAQAQKVTVRKNSGATDVGTRPRLNLIEGDNVTLDIADDATDNEIDVTINSSAGAPSPIGCRVHNSADLTIPDSTWTTLTYDTDDFDLDNMHDPSGANPERITFNTAGYYLVHAQVYWRTVDCQYKYLRIYLNGTDILSGAQEYYDTSLNDSKYWGCETLYHFDVGDYIEARVYQNSGGDTTIYAAVPGGIVLEAFKLG